VWGLESLWGGRLWAKDFLTLLSVGSDFPALPKEKEKKKKKRRSSSFPLTCKKEKGGYLLLEVRHHKII
jgi:hypothetical protein